MKWSLKSRDDISRHDIRQGCSRHGVEMILYDRIKEMIYTRYYIR